MNGRLTWKYLVPLAGAYVCLHGTAVVLGGRGSMAADYLFALIASWAAFVVCSRCAFLAARETHVLWAFFACSIFLWSCGMSLSAWEDLSQRVSETATYYSDFAYYLYGFPILLAIASPSREERGSLFLWLDVVQVLMTALLVYVTFFSVIPLSHQSSEPIRVNAMVRAYDFENLFLASGASLRLLTLNDDIGERRHFFRILAAFLWIYGISASLHNHLFLTLNGKLGVLTVLASLPFVLLLVAVLLPRSQTHSTPPDLLDRPIALFIENASPVFYTAALFALAIVQIRRHYALGVATLALALVIYAIRAITLQGRSMRSERALREARNWLEEMSLQDGLTGISNRRHFDNTLQSEWTRGIRTRLPLSLLLMDIDHFKVLNDTYGHLAGDRCLVEIAAALREMVPRKGDLLARYGGEEFGVILTATDSEGAQLLAGRICSAIAEINVAEPNSEARTITLSIGVSTVNWSSELTPQEMIDQADRALYQAKRRGRNRVQVFAEMIASLPENTDLR